MTRKTHTSWEVKQRYNNKVYGRITVALPKDLVTEFKEACKDMEVSQASIFKQAVEEFVEDYREWKEKN